MKTCSHKNCSSFVFSKGLCSKHWKEVYSKPLKRTPIKKANPVQMISSKLFVAGEAKQEPKNKKGIRKMSLKRSIEMKIYWKKRKKFLEEKKECEAKLEGCTKTSTAVHHTKGRTNSLLNETRYWIAICNNCHRKITDDSAMAILNNLSVSRNKKGSDE